MNSSSNHWAFGFIYYLIVASYTTWMVKDVVSNIKAQNIPECHESTYAYWIASNIIFLALSTIWMVKEIPLNNFVRPAVLIRIRVIDYLDEDVSKPEHESTCAFWIASNILFLALSTIWMVKDVVSNLKDQDIAKPECHTSTYAVWIPTNIIFFASSTIWMVKEIPLKQFLTDQSVLTPSPDFMPFHVQCLKCVCIFGKSPIFTMLTR